MRILFVIPIYLENIDVVRKLHFLGGGGRYPFELAKNIAGLKKDKVEMLFFGKSDKSISFAGMKISTVASVNMFPQINGPLNPLPLSVNFFRKISQADIVHGIQIRTEATMIATLFAKIIGKPIFLTDNNFNGLSLSRLIKAEYFANGVLAISKEDYDSWNAKNKEIIYGGVDMTKFRYKKEKQKYVLYAGRIVSHKGVDVLVNAMPKDYELIIAGSVLEKDFLKYLKKIAQDKNVKFIENPSDRQIISLYQNASCFVLPATARDYVGKAWKRPGLYALVVPEAMSCGTPVIVSNVGALPYFIEKDLNGFTFKDRDIVDLGNKISKIINNKNLMEKMGRNGRDLVELKYSWQVIARKVREIYRQFIDEQSN